MEVTSPMQHTLLVTSMMKIQRERNLAVETIMPITRFNFSSRHHPEALPFKGKDRNRLWVELEAGPTKLVAGAEVAHPHGQEIENI